MTFKAHTLSNGLTVGCDYIPHVETVSIGVYTSVGSRFEANTAQNGIAHFLEHMAFKGTTTRSAEDISREIEDVGGYMNAFTSRESTAYYIRVLKEDLPLAVDILSDIMLNSTFVQDEIERERGVILQEIGMYNDTPDDAVFENFQTLAFPDQPLGRNILGTVQTVSDMSRADFIDFTGAHYHTGNMLISAAGNISPDDLMPLLEEKFKALPQGKKSSFDAASYKGGTKTERRDLEQANIVLGYQGQARGTNEALALDIWTNAVGGGMATPLFQEVREKRGLVYSVYAFSSGFSDTGLFGVYAGCGENNVNEVLSVTRDVLADQSENLTEEGFNRAKTQMRAGLRMSLESIESRMNRIASSYFVHGKYRTMEQILASIDAVTMDDAMAAAKHMLKTPETLSLLGAIS
jgi:predicted Zn-dependent peptidase